MSGPAFGLALALLSSLTSVISHAFFKASEDRLAIRGWCCVVEIVFALPIALWTGWLPLHLLPYAAGFGLVGGLYQLLLIRSYRLSDFSAAYPVARGVVPLAMALLGVAVLGDQLSAVELLAIGATATGIVLLAFGNSMSAHGWGAALLTGLTTIGYNLLAAKGMREATNPLNFLAWLLVADSVLIPLVLCLGDPTGAKRRMVATVHSGWSIGMLMLVSYSAFAFAMRIAPIGPVSAIRESSVLIGLVLAAAILKERLGTRRIAAGLLIVAGAVTLAFA